MLSENEIKEELSYAYLHAVAAAAGFSVDRPHKDNDSVDAVVSARGKLDPDSKRESPRLEIQLKATEKIDSPSETFSFSLPIKNYNDLRGRRALPRLLVVLALPNDRAQWLTHSVEGLVSRRCAYWCSLLGLPDTENVATQSVTVSCSNVLSPDTLRSLMVRVSQMEEIAP